MARKRGLQAGSWWNRGKQGTCTPIKASSSNLEGGKDGRENAENSKGYKSALGCGGVGELQAMQTWWGKIDNRRGFGSVLHQDITNTTLLIYKCPIEFQMVQYELLDLYRFSFQCLNGLKRVS